jgi:hypothetical protein
MAILLRVELESVVRQMHRIQAEARVSIRHLAKLERTQEQVA